MKKNYSLFGSSARSLCALSLIALLVLAFSLCAILSLGSFAASLDAYGATPGKMMESDTDSGSDGDGRNLNGVGNGTDMDMDMGMGMDKENDNTDNGKVLDGDRGDRAGVIGDEKDNQGSVQGATDEGGSNDGTFWGIVIALAIAAAVILLIALILPKEKNTGSMRK